MTRSSKSLIALLGFQLLFLSTICNALYTPRNSRGVRGLHKLEINPQAVITGDKLVFVYQRNDEDFYFHSAQASDDENSRDLYEFSSASTEDLVTIRVSDGEFLYVENEMLTVSDTEYSNFKIVPIADSKTKFTLQVGSDFLVSPSSRPPFTFYLQSRYPDEPAATFEVAELTVAEYYNDQRENINMTLEFIRGSTLINKEAGYSDLFTYMGRNGHVDGAEIFTLARYISEDLGVSSDAFKALPDQVQLITSEGLTSLTYEIYTPMKYNWASSEHQNILSYNFTRDNVTGLYAITYANRNQLSARINEDLLDVLSDTKEFIFQLRYYISAANPYVQLYTYHEDPTSNNKFHPIVEKADNELDIYFESRLDSTGSAVAANFYVNYYSPPVGKQ